MIIKKFDINQLKRVFYVNTFEKDLKKQFAKSNAELTEYYKYLLANLTVLDEAATPPTEGNFEKLTLDNYNIYRLKSPSKRKNVRVLYFYLENDNIILLSAFQEKNKSDYKNNINKAVETIKNIERGNIDYE